MDLYSYWHISLFCCWFISEAQEEKGKGEKGPIFLDIMNSYGVLT